MEELNEEEKQILGSMIEERIYIIDKARKKVKTVNEYLVLDNHIKSLYKIAHKLEVF